MIYQYLLCLLVIIIITSIYETTENNNEVSPYEGNIEKEISLIQELESF